MSSRATEKSLHQQCVCQNSQHSDVLTHIILNFNWYRFDLCVEPVFAVMALYDAKEKKKISESFHLDCNTSDIQQKWRDSKEEKSMASLARSAIFNITYPNSDVYLIIKVGSPSLLGDSSCVTDCIAKYTVIGDNYYRDPLNLNLGNCPRLQ